MNDRRPTASVVMTVRNDPDGCSVTLDSLISQTRRPDEMIVVDGDSTDGTVARIETYARLHPWIRVLRPGRVNIARGRNLGIAVAGGDVIATIDAGCRAEPQWLEELLAPFENDPEIEFVGGFYRLEPHSLLEHVAGLATMRGQLEPVDPATFNPSARSMAFTRSLWRRAGGFPEWIRYSEDTLFDHRIRRLGVNTALTPTAVVHWRPRRSFRSIARQFFGYGTGRGHTQIDAAGFRYNLRNAALLLGTSALAILEPWWWFVAAGLFLYFQVWAFHDKASAIARHTHRALAYPLTMLVMWVVQVSHSAGYLVGSWQRFRDRHRYVQGLNSYLSGAVQPTPWAAEPCAPR